MLKLCCFDGGQVGTFEGAKSKLDNQTGVRFTLVGKYAANRSVAVQGRPILYVTDRTLRLFPPQRRLPPLGSCDLNTKNPPTNVNRTHRRLMIDFGLT
jgi:hypothetical protein